MKALCINKSLFSKDGLSLFKNNNIQLSFANNLDKSTFMTLYLLGLTLI